MKRGHINNELKLLQHTEITYLKEGNMCRFLISTPKTYEYIECEDPNIT
jgi:hypothetical protein